MFYYLEGVIKRNFNFRTYWTILHLLTTRLSSFGSRYEYDWYEMSYLLKSATFIPDPWRRLPRRRVARIFCRRGWPVPAANYVGFLCSGRIWITEKLTMVNSARLDHTLWAIIILLAFGVFIFGKRKPFVPCFQRLFFRSPPFRIIIKSCFSMDVGGGMMMTSMAYGNRIWSRNLYYQWASYQGKLGK